MYPIPPTEKLVETKICRHCGMSFPITDKDLEFYEKVSPVFNGQKYQIPTPTLCPDCRQQRRLSFRNERKLYKRKCDATGRDIISIYSPDKSFKVYHQDFWWSDKWDPMDYGRDFDFSRPFFEQFGELMREIPGIAIIGGFNENSDYVNCGGYNKNSYLCFDVGWVEDCLFVSRSYKIKQSTDLFSCIECENSYELIDNVKCNLCSYCIDTEHSSNCHFCYFCKGCNDCFLCTNLINKSYCIENIQYSKEEYFRKVSELRQLHPQELQQIFIKKMQNSIHKCNSNLSCENVLGDALKECSNSFNSFGSQQCENVKFSGNSMTLHDSYDDNFSGNNGFLDCETIGCEQLSKCLNCISCWQGNTSLLYSCFCHSSQNLFGCIGLRNKSYCIFNKQYTKEEYEELVPKIIEHMRKTGEWGEFFPSSLSPFGYNETVAQEYYPLSRDEQIPPTPLTKGGGEERAGGLVHGSVFNWSDYEAPFPRVEKIIPAAKLPEDIAKIPDDILNWAIECEVTGKPFRIIKQELEFYRKHNLPIPRRHPDQRHLDRMSLRNPRKLFERKCDKCGVEMMTTYAPERPEVVYCEGCYEKEIL